MKDLLFSARALLQDLAATILFLVLFALTRNVVLSVALGLALAIGQTGWHLAKGRKIDALQWVSVIVVIAAGASTLITRNPVFVMLKPSVIYVLVGWAMLQRGWMNRYLPSDAQAYLPDLCIAFGYVWSGLMFFSAALNLWAALNLGVVAWGTLMSIWGIASKFALFFLQYGVMKFIGRRRYRARMVPA